jgi:hypothetical protein
LKVLGFVGAALTFRGGSLQKTIRSSLYHGQVDVCHNDLDCNGAVVDDILKA